MPMAQRRKAPSAGQSRGTTNVAITNWLIWSACLAAARKRDHGELANKVLGLGNLVQIEKVSYKGLQKNFGRSAKVRASGMFVSLLTLERKGGNAVNKPLGGMVVVVDPVQRVKKRIPAILTAITLAQ
jgi:hypothetical protein